MGSANEAANKAIVRRFVEEFQDQHRVEVVDNWFLETS
jgi:hypothetical protein